MTAQCPICRKEPSWKPMDIYRIKPQGMAMCGHCGFVSYPDRIANKEAILKHYEVDYRSTPTVDNIFTGQRKLQYHGAFLGDLFKKWTDEGRKNLVVTDVGSAIGLFLQWVRGFFPDADLLGVELTKTYVRNAWEMFKVKSVTEFDDSKKYDLISSYKSLEHIVDPDKELARYIAALKDDGFLYFGVPIWFESMRNFGLNHFDIEGYYDPNHINVWARKHVEGLIRACGGEIVKENRTMYDTAYLIKKSQADIPDAVELSLDRSHAFDDPAEVEKKMAAIFLASDEMGCGRVDAALNIWPNFPMAWANKYEMLRKQLHLAGGLPVIMRDFIDPMLQAMPDDPDAHTIAADLLMRYEALEDALKHLNVANSLRPNQTSIFLKTADCYRMLAKRAASEDERIKFIKLAREMTLHARNFDSAVFREATSLIMQDNARIPAPFEVET